MAQMKTFTPKQALVSAVMVQKGEAAAHSALFGLCLYYVVFDWWYDDIEATHLHLLRALPFLYKHGRGTFCCSGTFQSCINIHIHSHMCTCIYTYIHIYSFCTLFNLSISDLETFCLSAVLALLKIVFCCCLF